MSVTEIIQSIKQLSPEELEMFYQQLDAIELANRENILAEARAEVARLGFTEKDVDRFISKRRYGTSNQ
jgi:hypothetical protein